MRLENEPFFFCIRKMFPAFRVVAFLPLPGSCVGNTYLTLQSYESRDLTGVSVVVDKMPHIC